MPTACKKAIIAPAVLAALALLLGHSAAQLFDDEPVHLLPGQTYAGKLGVGPDGDGWTMFYVEVPANALVLDVELRCSLTDLDLFVSHDDDEYESYSSELEFGVERVVFDRFSDHPVRAGTYTVEVEYPWLAAPIWEGKSLTEVEYTVSVRVLRPRVDAKLSPGEPVESRIDTASGRFKTFTIEVPEGASALRVDVLETHADLDLFARRGKPILRVADARHFARHPYGRETLLITADSEPPLRAGRWFLDVVDYGAFGDPDVAFKLLVGFDAAVPPVLLEIPPLRTPEPGDALDTALCAVVELFAGDGGGSASVLTPGGLALTNAHVVADYADQPVSEVVVAAPLRYGHPSVELFRADVVEFDWERDLALIQVKSGLYGQALPAGYRFPTVPLGDPAALRLGQPLWAVGYPWTGGTGTRASITVTQGIVCGFEELSHLRLVKTDAEIASGNSGGAALTRDGALIGVPTTIMEDRSSQLSFLVPVSAIPEAWRARIEAGTR